MIKVETRNEHNIVVGKPEGKRPLGSPWCRWEVNTTCKTILER